MRIGLAWRECPINATKQTGSITPDRQKQPQEAELQRKKPPAFEKSRLAPAEVRKRCNGYPK
jgi:hypothetical protein